MRRAIFSLSGIAIGLIAWVITSACNQQSIVTPVRSFDRPTDVALACVKQRSDDGLYDVHPLSDCNPNVIGQQQTDMGTPSVQPFLGPGANQAFLMALVTQSARGEVALVDTNREKLVSLQPKDPGFGFLPVGLLPEHIRATDDGCTAVTSNTDSCDYGVIDIPTVINTAVPPLDMAGTKQQGGLPAGVGTNVVRRIVAAVPDGNGGARVLPARPSWIEIAPESTPGKSGVVPGQCVGGAPKAWVALPNCELVVELDLTVKQSTDPRNPGLPNVINAIKVTRSGAQVVSDLSTLTCPAECAGEGMTAPSDLGAPPPTDMAGDGGVPPLVSPTQAYPGTLAVDTDNGRLVIGDLYGERIDIIPVDKAGNLGAPRKVQLEHGAAGVKVVRLSPRSYAGQFLYAIARDGTVRVIDMDRETECETNPDPRFMGDGINLQDNNPPVDPTPQARQLGCFPLGDPSTPPRAWYATSPGISLNPGELPKDVAFVHLELPPGVLNSTTPPPAAAPGLLVGDFAWIVSSDGRGTVVNIFDACPQPNQQDVNNQTGPFTPICSLDPNHVAQSRQQTLQNFGHPVPYLLDRLSHRLRGGHLRFDRPPTAADPLGMPRVADEFNPFAVGVPSTSAGTDAGAGPRDAGASPNLPGLYEEPLPASETSTFDTAPTRVIKFVDPDRAKNEIWSLDWEGVLPGTSRTLGQWLPDGYFTDNGGAWCARGVMKGDKLLYTGCLQDGDCDYTEECVHDPSAPADVLNGMCLAVYPPTYTIDYWSRVCGPLLRAQRKYRILSARMHQPLPEGIPPPPPPGQTPGQPTTPAPGDMGGSSSTLATDWLKLAEIYEPEYADQTTTCNSDADCSGITIQPASGPAGALATRCLPDIDEDGNPVKRCLLGCDASKGDDPASPQPRCGSDFECYKSTQGDLRCMRAPLDDGLFRQCMVELQRYEIHAGNSFIVSGTVSGFLSDVQPDATGECVMPPATNEYVRMRNWRVPLDPPVTCPSSLFPSPPSTSPLDSLDRSLDTNVCVVPPATGLTQARIVHWENGIFNIAPTIPVDANGKIIVPPDGTSIAFTVTGGGVPLSAPLGVDVQAEDPTYALVAPDKQTVYIVDAGKSNQVTGLRGQLLRLFSPTQTVDHLFVVR